ncbi:DNA cytosine methyltransferase [Terrabacter lapilli]|uniref:DNA (cytosine-5-)-methyltransferase n=1 Tax=Terrabacter lapilli TaxID=436231 RepID=A0ABN2S4G0_9MICO
MDSIPVIDLFAGPGGLNEGFCSLLRPDGAAVFSTAASIEMDPVACSTLRLRAAVRRLRGSQHALGRYKSFLRGELSWESFSTDTEVRTALDAAEKEVHELELGPDQREEASKLIRTALSERSAAGGMWVLIGGPPCQAYSLVGRARRTNDPNFEDDVKHFLFKEYLDIITAHRPPVFVMENVKGLLSHTHRGERLFSRILDDLANAGDGYEVRSFAVSDDSTALFPGLRPSDYVIRAEQYGVPQRRHRVILLGVRSDISATRSKVLRPSPTATVEQAIGHLPRVRSRISPARDDRLDTWKQVRDKGLRMAKVIRGHRPPLAETGWARGGPALGHVEGSLEQWLTRAEVETVVQHEARGHMVLDLMRYAYLSAKAMTGEAVKLGQLPEALVPEHANARRIDAPFSDRFRVQTWTSPSTTVTSHISKDGHYYIHPDPGQMRSLTVREAARLQTFPDDYFFWGNRTQQYHQVGNAVPPYLSLQLAEVVAGILGVSVA